METIKLTVRTDDSGTLHLELPTGLANHEVEVLVVLQAARDEAVDNLGWPVDYFASIDSIEADDIIERPDQGDFEEREPIE